MSDLPLDSKLIEQAATDLFRELESKPVAEPTSSSVKSIPMNDVLETILDQGGAEGKLASGSPYISINKEYWAKISTVDGKKWVKVLKVVEGDHIRFTREDGQAFLEMQDTPLPPKSYSFDNYPGIRTFNKLPSAEDNVLELTNMVLATLKSFHRDHTGYLDSNQLFSLKNTINALTWFNKHQTKPTFWQKIWLKIKGNYWSF